MKILILVVLWWWTRCLWWRFLSCTEYAPLRACRKTGLKSIMQRLQLFSSLSHDQGDASADKEELMKPIHEPLRWWWWMMWGVHLKKVSFYIMTHIMASTKNSVFFVRPYPNFKWVKQNMQGVFCWLMIILPPKRSKTFLSPSGWIRPTALRTQKPDICQICSGICPIFEIPCIWYSAWLLKGSPTVTLSFPPFG